jgi:hypothetical protein
MPVTHESFCSPRPSASASPYTVYTAAAHNPQAALNQKARDRDKARARLVIVNEGKLPRGLGGPAAAVHTRIRGLRGTYVRELAGFERVPHPVSPSMNPFDLSD